MITYRSIFSVTNQSNYKVIIKMKGNRKPNTSYTRHLNKDIKTHTGIGYFEQGGIKILMLPTVGPLSEL